MVFSTMLILLHKSEKVFYKLSGTDLSKELALIKTKMIKEFDKKGESPIYDPDEFEEFCCQAGAVTIFDNLQNAVCTIRQSSTRLGTNRQTVVSIIYQLCYTLRHRCNFIQKNNTIFLVSENLKKEAINTHRRLGLACSSQTAHRHLHSVEESYKKIVEDAISLAITNKHLIVANLDDYHNIHTVHHPDSPKQSTATHM